MNLLRPTLLSLACLLASPALVADDLPSLGDASSAIVSQEQEHQLGRAWLSMLRNQVPQLSDPQLKDFVESSVYRLAETSQLQDRRLEFILLNSSQINAFAAPGGIVGVNGGLFLYAQTEAEYAAVLAHELAHLSQRHFARGVEAQQRMQIPLMAAMLAGIVAAAAGAGDAGIAAIASSQAAAIQEQRRFSRQNEQEADRIGLINLEKAGYDPQAMPSMFERLMRQYRYDAKPPEFLLTHPVTESRIADTRNRAEQIKQPGGKEDTLRYQLMRARVQLIYEETPGIAAKRFRAMLDENPKLDAARYGLAIAKIKAGQLNEARDALQELLAKAPDEITYNLAQVELDITANRLPDAKARVDRLLTLYPNSYPLKQARTDLLVKMSQPQQAEKTLNDLLQSRPNDPDVWYQVAEVRGLAGNTIGLHQARAEYFALVGDYDQAIEQLDFAKRRAGGNFPLASRIDARQKDLINEQRMVKGMLR
ncbi:M48 family metalloprotease [Pseudomonas mangiferae]|uniref:Putative beta-barrel assembly-enhancing protease n=1 Tax=Pseudomonas mangiferae TaxID=2593654 RepID=A0A553H1N2_9PSED|nr:M48 family metalloprotease [Pseudomonas mangiferae]TRX75632.1 M48 family metallopeptidase [Pseudomonas mangiferae]